MSKKTLVIGATTDPKRYAYLAIERLREHGHEVVALGKQSGLVEDVVIETEAKDFKNIDTVTLYINPLIQRGYYDYLMSIKPKRIIFNPGTENPELESLATQHGVSAERACTLVMLSVGNY